MQTRDLRPLPGGYGHGRGSGTLAKWITQKMKEDDDAAASTLAPTPSFPAHWGNPPGIQTMDYRPLPGGYGHGSSTVASWIQQSLDSDNATAADEKQQGNKENTLRAIGPAWTYNDSVEAPAGEKNMGTWTMAVYTPEQRK